jgi:hypothetical protein
MELSNPLISEYTWANKPSVAPLGQIICVTDVGENGILCRGNGTKWIKLHAVKYYNNTTPVSLTGTTAETTMLTIPIKGGLIGANGVLAIQPLWNANNNANSKTIRIKLGATTCYSYGTVNLLHQDAYINVRNIGSESSQKTTSGMAGGMGGTVNNYNSTSTDTSADFNIVVTGQLANSADTMAIQAFLITVL